MAITLPNFVSAALDVIGVALLVALLYYALATLFWMRGGKLEKSWRYMSRSVIVLSIGVLFFASSLFAPPNLVMLLTWTTSALMICGTFLLLLGFRSHYRVWSGAEFRDKERNRIEP